MPTRPCKYLVVWVDMYMPRVFGDSQLLIPELDTIVENDALLLVLPERDPRTDEDIMGE